MPQDLHVYVREMLMCQSYHHRITGFVLKQNVCYVCTVVHFISTLDYLLVSSSEVQPSQAQAQPQPSPSLEAVLPHATHVFIHSAGMVASVAQCTSAPAVDAGSFVHAYSKTGDYYANLPAGPFPNDDWPSDHIMIVAHISI